MNIICKSGFTWLQKNMGKITTCSKVVTFLTNPDMIHYPICMQIRPERCFLTHHNLFSWKQSPPGLTGSLTSLPRFPSSADRECSTGVLYQKHALLVHHLPIYSCCPDTLRRRLLANRKGGEATDHLSALVLDLQLCSLFFHKEDEVDSGTAGEGYFPTKRD